MILCSMIVAEKWKITMKDFRVENVAQEFSSQGFVDIYFKGLYWHLVKGTKNEEYHDNTSS